MACETHQYRANGGSFFNEQGLAFLKKYVSKEKEYYENQLAVVGIKEMFPAIDKVDFLEFLLMAINKELAYVKSTKE